MKSIFIITAMLISIPAHAEIFKCANPVTKRVKYQPTPCEGAVIEQSIEIKKRSADEEARAARARDEWEARYEAEEAEKAARRQAEYELRLREAEVAAKIDDSAAQRGQAAAQFQQAEEMRRANELKTIVPFGVYRAPRDIKPRR
jgi:hypothetical protein